MRKESERLIRRLKTNDLRAFRALIDMYYGRVFDLCLWICRNTHHVQDLVVHTFVTAKQRIHEYDFTVPFEVWLYSIAVSDSLQVSHDEEQLNITSTDEVEQCLRQIPLYPKLTLVLKSVHHLTLEEMAYVLNCKVEAIKAYLRQGRELLQVQRSKQMKTEMLVGS
ncbi:RNA polymerase sigma factor [Paenibacillus sanguinis]|uniref:RNA polymerase sigma factor n=1 Tax=Paenibacillus sanguinis TaxID=225906 RepID=UPI0003616EBB|nr:sigma factor [Paenibacillus sanguinis]